MGRRKARELALQALFQVDLGGADPLQAINYLASETGAWEEDVAFTRELVKGTLDHLRSIDEVISSLSEDWDLKRMAGVDRNVMRIALFEVFYRDDIPASVSVNEAVELVKIFGGEDSSRFVNGILGKVVKDLDSFKKRIIDKGSGNTS